MPSDRAIRGLAGSALLLASCWWLVRCAAPARTPEAARVRLPVYFELNRGQAARDAEYVARGGGRTVLLRRDGAVLPGGVGMKFPGASSEARLEGEAELRHHSHYLLGAEAQRWLKDVPHFAQVRYRNLYAGVDLVFYEGRGGLEYDFELAPGAKAEAIRLKFEGAEGLRMDPGGALLVRVKGGGEIRQSRPKVYRKGWGRREQVAGRYVVLSPEEVGFEVEGSGNGWGLLIDPELSFSSYLGGAGADLAYGVAVDAMGNSYVTGVTGSAGLGGGVGGQTIQVGGPTDAFVAKLTAAGALEWVTYVGGGGPAGGTGNDEGRAVAVDAQGNVWVAGRTNSSNFPVTRGSLQEQPGGGWDGFLSKLDPTGSKLLYSTYVGGTSTDEVYGLAVSPSGEAHLTGSTSSTDSFPATQNAFQRFGVRTSDAFVTKFDRYGGLVFSTFLGGWDSESGYAIALDHDGNVIVAGSTQSFNFPVKDALQPNHGAANAYLSADGGATWRTVPLTAKVRIRSYAVEPANPAKMYVGTTQGVFRSTDDGSTWSDAGLANLSVIALAADPASSGVLYAGGESGGLYKSTDGGVRWTAMNTGLRYGAVNSIAVDSTDRQRVFAAVGGTTVFRSTNGGQQWTQLAADAYFGANPTVVAIDAKSPATVYAGTAANGIFRSSDSGDTWKAINTGLAPGSIASIAVDPSAAFALYIAAPSSTGGFYRSVNAGESWTRLETGLSAANTRGIVVDPNNPSTVFAAASNGLARSDDGGSTWQRVTIPLGIDPVDVSALRNGPANTSLLFVIPAIPQDAFVAKFSPAGSLLWSTYLGKAGREEAYGVAVDLAGNVYLAGVTHSADFPATPGAFQTSLGGASDAFVAKLDRDGRKLLYSTFIGGPNTDEGIDVAATPRGEAIVAGWAGANLPTTPNAVQRGHRGGDDAFIGVLDPEGARLTYLSYLGGTRQERLRRMALDASGVWLAGSTLSIDFPIVAAAQRTASGQDDAFISRFSGLFEPAELALIAPQSLAQATAGSAYVQALGALGGAPPYRWVIESGALAPGLSFDSATGVIDGAPLVPGSFSFQVRVTDRSGMSVSRSYTLVVGAPSRLTITTPSQIPPGGLGTPYSYTLIAAGGSPPYGWEIAGGSLPDGLELSGASGEIRGAPSSTGTFPFKARVRDGAGGVNTKDLAITVAPAVAVKAVVNGASMRPGPVAPGQVVTLFGSGLGPAERATPRIEEGRVATALGGTAVLVDNIPAPLLYAQWDQLSAVVPFAVAGTAQARLQVVYKGAQSATVPLRVAPASPGLFTLDSSGGGQGLVFNQDDSLNSAANPASPGSLVSLFVTGLGETDPVVADGTIATTPDSPRPRLPVSVKIGGVEARVEEAGPVPGMVVGVFRVRVRLSASVPAGDAVGIELIAGENAAQPDVTMAVK